MRSLSSSCLLAPLSLVLACSEPAAPLDGPTTATKTPAPAQANAAEAAAQATAAKGAGVLRTVHFPGGDLSLPVAWGPKVREESAMTAVHVMPAVGMTCDLAILVGHGTQKQAEEYLAAGANAYNGDTARAPAIEVGGHAFQGIRVTKPKALPGAEDAVVEVYAAITGEDLVGIGVTRLEQKPSLDDGRTACLQAFAQLTSLLPPASPPAP